MKNIKFPEKISQVKILGCESMKLGEAFAKVYKRINEVEKKIIRLETNIAITGLEYGAFGSGGFGHSKSPQTPTFESKESNIDQIDDKSDKTTLIAEIQEAQRRKIEEDPEKRKLLTDQRHEKENILKASILQAQSAMLSNEVSPESAGNEKENEQGEIESTDDGDDGDDGKKEGSDVSSGTDPSNSPTEED